MTPPTDGDENQPESSPSDNGRQTGGRFGAGNRFSLGRKVGARNRATQVVEKILQGGAKDVATAMLTAAQTGNVQAGLAVLNRLAPPARFISQPIPIAQVTTAEEAKTEIAKLVSMAAAGEIALDDCEVLCAGLRAVIDSRIVEVEQRLQALADRLAREDDG
jgi:hypothetical protein